MSAFVQALKNYFTLGNPLEPVVTEDDLRPAYSSKPPIADYLPWIDIIDDNKILLEDAKSVAAVFDVTLVPTEARSRDYMETQRNQIREFITGAFEEHSSSPWVVSTYSWLDTDDFKNLPDRVAAHAHAMHAMRDTAPDNYTQYFVDEILRPHVADMTAPGGLFKDPLSKDRPWGGATRKVHIVFYRRQSGGGSRRKNMTPEEELDTQCRRVMQTLKTAGINARRLKGEEIRNWLFRWFNPRPKQTNGDVREWLAMNPYAKPTEERPADWDLSTDVTSRNVSSDAKNQCWFFDGKPHTILSVERMTSVPKIGQISAERYVNESEKSGANAQTVCLIDELPPNSMVIINYVVHPQSAVRKNLEGKAKSSKGDTPEARATREEINHARHQMARGNKLYPFSMGIALSAEDLDGLERAILDTDIRLASNGLQLIDPDDDLVRLDRYIRFLPGAYDPALDLVGIRQRLIYTHHLANLLPFYGRSTGTGNPCIVSFNRGGEAFTCDPLLQGDRAKNAHLFLFGPTGAGKSATLVYLQMFITAVYNPRWVVVEAGNSFGLLSVFFKKMGKTVKDYVFRPGQAPSMAPYKPLLDLVDQHGNIIQDHTRVEQQLTGEVGLEDADKGDNFDETVQRDILGEMLIIARLMVTGGEAQEDARMTRADVGMLKSALLNAAVNARKSNKKDVLTEDVIQALSDLKIEKADRAKRIDEMCDAMRLFCDGFAGELFNRPGEEMEDADYIRIEMGALASGNDTNDKLSVAYICIINQVIARAYKTQRDGRPTINLTDEAHVITTNPLLSHYLVVVSKLLGRRMGLWLWQATQNMKDYPDAAEKMLAMFEWWMCLFIDQGELTNIERFKALNEDQRQMLLSTTKVPKKYTEGVIMSDNVQGLFRMVPPGICLALGQSEKEEKRARSKIMKEQGVDETDAAIIIGKAIAAGRRKAALATES